MYFSFVRTAFAAALLVHNLNKHVIEKITFYLGFHQEIYDDDFTVTFSEELIKEHRNILLENNTVVTFSEGSEGFTENSFITHRKKNGNPDGNMRIFNPDTFGVTIATDTNDDFLGDYFTNHVTRLGLDVKVKSISYFGTEVRRNLIVKLIDKSDDVPVSVWYDLGELPRKSSGWVSLAVDVPLQEDLPSEWGGTGDWDEYMSPILPANRTYGSVLRNVDEVSFTTLHPGFMYTFAYFNLRVDNILIATGD